jgi:hypothetical protein
MRKVIAKNARKSIQYCLGSGFDPGINLLFCSGFHTMIA